jgi:hypothetical protein
VPKFIVWGNGKLRNYDDQWLFVSHKHPTNGVIKYAPSFRHGRGSKLGSKGISTHLWQSDDSDRVSRRSQASLELKCATKLVTKTNFPNSQASASAQDSGIGTALS